LGPTHRSAPAQFSNYIAGLCEQFAEFGSVSVGWLGRFLVGLDPAVPDTLPPGRYSVVSFYLQFRNEVNFSFLFPKLLDELTFKTTELLKES
jgi:hypothetical protein